MVGKSVNSRRLVTCVYLSSVGELVTILRNTK